MYFYHAFFFNPSLFLRKCRLFLHHKYSTLSDMVAVMGETTAFRPILENIRRRMERDVSGNRLLRYKIAPDF